MLLGINNDDLFIIADFSLPFHHRQKNLFPSKIWTIVKVVIGVRVHLPKESMFLAQKNQRNFLVPVLFFRVSYKLFN
jgi:hypothetical protein